MCSSDGSKPCFWANLVFEEIDFKFYECSAIKRYSLYYTHNNALTFISWIGIEEFSYKSRDYIKNKYINPKEYLLLKDFLEEPIKTIRVRISLIIC